MKEKKFTCSLNKLINKRLISTSKQELHKIFKKTKNLDLHWRNSIQEYFIQFMVNSWACILKYMYILFTSMDINSGATK